MKKRASLMRNFDKLLDRLDCADLVICIHDTDKRDIICHHTFQFRWPDKSLACHGQVHSDKAPVFQILAWLKHCIMFYTACNYHILLRHFAFDVHSRALESKIICLSSTGCERDFTGG